MQPTSEDEYNKVVDMEAWNREVRIRHEAWELARQMRRAERAEERRQEDEADCCLMVIFLPCFILFIVIFILDVMTG
jgi:hypothetical protein